MKLYRMNDLYQPQYYSGFQMRYSDSAMYYTINLLGNDVEFASDMSPSYLYNLIPIKVGF